MIRVKNIKILEDNKLRLLSKEEIQTLTEDDLTKIVLITKTNRFFRLREINGKES